MREGWVLVVGADDFIGSRLVRHLVGQGERVVALVQPGAVVAHLADLPRSQFRVRTGDFRVTASVYASLAGCDRMLHCGVLPGARAFSRRSAPEVVQTTQAALEAAKAAGIERVVIGTSALSLGLSESREPLVEVGATASVGAGSIGHVVRCAEEVALEAVADGVPVVVVQPGMVVGPGDVIPSPMGALLLRYLHWPSAFKVPSLAGGFSYADVDDVAAGYQLAMERGEVGGRYLLGGENLEHREVYTLLHDLTGLAEPGEPPLTAASRRREAFSQILARFSGQRPMLRAETRSSYAGKFSFLDSSKATRELGYSFRPARAAFVRAVRYFVDSGRVDEAIARKIRLPAER